MIKTFPVGGIHPPETKLTAGSRIELIPPPAVVAIPLSQHIGTPAVPVVAKGDKVLAGQVIAKSDGFVSTNIHSSVSGIVSKIDATTDTSGYKQNSVIIEVKGDEWVSTADRSSVVMQEISLTGDEIIERCLESGIVGLGGATFPTHIKLKVPHGKKCDILIINGAECEPYLTSDHSLMLERGAEIIVGIRAMMKALNVDRAIIGIENNKPDAIENLRSQINGSTGIVVTPLKVKYPQGGEKQLIKALINREVPSGRLPVDVGAVVQNVGTAFAVYEAVQKNKPLIERVVTVTGSNLSKPGNYLVRIGTMVTKLIEAAGGLPDDTGKILNGGPMMGKAIPVTEIPVTKGTSGIVVLPSTLAARRKSQPCIRCGKCISACAMNLEPYLLMAMSERGLFERAGKERITDCMECGSCSYTCPAGRPLLDYIRHGKTNVIRINREEKLK